MGVELLEDLASEIPRCRSIIETNTIELVGEEEIKDFLVDLAPELGMKIIGGPWSGNAHDRGYQGYVHWRDSGCAVYTYPRKSPLFAVEASTCKPFSLETSCEFVKKYFQTEKVLGVQLMGLNVTETYRS